MMRRIVVMLLLSGMAVAEDRPSPAYEGCEKDLELLHQDPLKELDKQLDQQKLTPEQRAEAERGKQVYRLYQAQGIRIATEEVLLAAQRLFDRYPLVGMSKPDALKLLGEPTPEAVPKWLDNPGDKEAQAAACDLEKLAQGLARAKQDPDASLHYTFQSDIMIFVRARTYTLRFKEGKVMGVDCPKRIPKGASVTPFLVSEELPAVQSPGKKYTLRVVVNDAGAAHSGNFWTWLVLSDGKRGDLVIAQGYSTYDVRYGRKPFPIEWDGEGKFWASFAKGRRGDGLGKFHIDIEENIRKCLKAKGEANVYDSP